MSVKSFSPLRNGCPRPIAPVSRSKTRRVAKLRFPCCCTSESPAPKLPPSNDSVVHRPLPKGGKPRLVTVFGRSTVLMSMVCPACGNQLNQLVAGGIVLDVCNGGCGGIWFDSFELQKIEAAQEATADLEIDVPRDLNRTGDYGKRRSCPKCHDVVLMRHYFSKLRQVVVDECPNCGGFWLDAGELEKIRSE